jgi:hypothetical protein
MACKKTAFGGKAGFERVDGEGEQLFIDLLFHLLVFLKILRAALLKNCNQLMSIYQR